MTPPTPEDAGLDRREWAWGRARIAELEARYHRVTRLIFASIAACVATIVLSVLLVQDSRIDTSRTACEATNTEHRGLRTFVTETAPALAPKIEATLPIEPDCHAAAVERVGPLVSWPW